MSESANQGEAISLSLAGSASGLKAVLGDSIGNGNSAAITLAECQVQASFPLVSDTGISADQVGAQAEKRPQCTYYIKRSAIRPYDGDIGCFYRANRCLTNRGQQ